MEAKDILSISAGLVAGAFIFLFLAIWNIDKTEREAIFHLDRQVFVANLVIASFSSSSIVALIAQFKKSKPAIYDHMMHVSMAAIMIIGFLILVGISLIVIIGIIHFID